MSTFRPLPTLVLPGESFAGRWGRRSVSVSLVLVLAAILWAGALFWLALAGFVDLVRGGGRRWGRVRCVGFFGLFLACEVAGLIGAAALWLGTAAGALVRPETYFAWNAAFQRAWSGALFWGGARIFGLKLAVEGNDVVLPAPFILLVRHSSTADTVFAAALVANPHRILLRYVLKRELLWDPCLDVVGRRLRNAFVDRSGRNPARELEAVAGLARGLGDRDGVLIYPDGTPFSPAKRARVIAKLREQGKEDAACAAEALSHVLPPRPGGTLALLEAAPDADVVTLVHTGLEDASSFRRFWRGAVVGATIRVRFSRVRAGEIPAGDRVAWLHERWAEVDRWVEAQRAQEGEGRS